MAVHQMRWSDKDVNEMYRIVKNFNQKVTYHFKNSPKKRGYLPSKVSIKDIKKNVTTRKDFNRILNHYERFSRSGQEEIITTKGGTTTTKWRLKEAKTAKRIKNIQSAYQDKKLGVPKATAGTMPSQRKIESAKINLEPSAMTPTELDKFEKMLQKRMDVKYYDEGYGQYMANYLKGIETQLNGDEELRKMILEMDPEDLYKMTAANPKLQIGFIYDKQQAIDIRKKYIKEELKKSA